MSTEDSAITSTPIWRTPSSYAYTWDLTREAWALEFLERNPTYAALVTQLRRSVTRVCRRSPTFCVIAAPTTADALQPWGLHFRRCTGSSVESETAFWRAEVNPSVLPVEAQPASAPSDDAFDIREFHHSVIVLQTAEQTEHVLLSDGIHHIQIEVRRGSVLDGPVKLRYDLAGSLQIEPKLIVVQRLLALQRLGRFPRSLYPTDHRAQRWRMALRALDGSRAGATHREIATALWGEEAVSRDWRDGSDYLRARVRRTIDIGETLAQGGYRRLLNG